MRLDRNFGYKSRNIARRIWMNYQLCKNKRVSLTIPKMGMIADARLAVLQKPFAKTEVDYFGPLIVKIGR